MNDRDEPGRLLDTTDDPMLRELLGAAQSELPSPERLAQVAARLPLGGGGSGGGGGPSTTTKVVLGLGALGAASVIVAALVVSATRAPEAPLPPPAALPSASVVEPAPSASVAPPASASVAPPPRLAPPRDASPVASEIELLKRAQDALGTDPTRALNACTEHAKSYPRGDLAQEREVLAVDALMRLGRKPEALRRARAFVAAHPGSSHQARLERLVGETL